MKKLKGYMYKDKLYKTEEELEQAIVECIGHKYNNMDVTQTSEYEYEQQFEVEEIYENEDVATSVVMDYIAHKK